MTGFDRSSVIEALDTEVVLVPLSRPVGTSIHQITSVGCVLVTIRTADGVTGEGFCFTIDGDRIRAFDEMVKGLARYAVGRSVFESGRMWADVWSAINPTGHKGVTVAGFSAIDTAVWDAAAKTAGLALHEMWGAVTDRLDTYASSGFWLSDPVETLVEEARRFAELGFRAVKVRIGHDLATDLERIRIVRAELGDDIAVYTDANQGFEPKEAIRRGLALADAGVTWFEEPVAAADFRGHAMVRQALPIDVASGETEYTKFGMQQYLDADSVDVLMPDLQRVGGYSEFRAAAAAASAANVPISSHFFTEYSLAIGASQAGCRTIEHIDWFQPLFAQTPELADGQLVVPDRPGHGFTFDRDAVAALRAM
ncbi:MAG: mandelate racemase/muconate lactonizing enzyme family protein [Actinomycetota bacterium]